MDIDTIKQLLELGWPAIITVFFGYLAIQYIADQRKQIATLWDHVNALEAQLRDMKSMLEPDGSHNIGDKPKRRI